MIFLRTTNCSTVIRVCTEDNRALSKGRIEPDAVCIIVVANNQLVFA